jgi:polar amino acid transport system substrate-binding protein
MRAIWLAPVVSRSLVLFLLLAASVLAQAPPEQAQTLRLGVNNWLFWRAHNNGTFSGPDVDIWREIARRNNLKIEYTFTPNLEDATERLQHDSIDAFVSLLKNPEREQYLYFIEPPIRTKLQYLTYVRADSNVSIERLEDMRSRTVAVPGPSGYTRFDNDPDIKKEFTPSWDVQVAADKLLDGRVEVLHMSDWQAMRLFKDHPQYRDKLKRTAYVHREYHPNFMVMSKRSPLAARVKDQIGRTIQGLLDDGTMKSIVERYLPGWWEYYTE